LSMRVAVIVALGLIVVLAPGAVADVLSLHGDEHYVLVYIALVGACEIAAALGFNVLFGLFRHPDVNRVLLIQSIGQPVLVIAAAAAGLGLSGILGGVLAGSALKAIVLNVTAYRAVHAIEETGAAPKMASTYTKVAGSALAGKISGWLHSRQIVTVIAMSAVSRPAVAVFSLAYDVVHQVLILASTPFYNLLIATFASTGRQEISDRRLLRLVTRGLALIALGLAAVLLATFTSLSAALFGSDYSHTVRYALIIVPALALEVTLSGPATALMTAREPMVAPYGRIKLVTCIAAGAYVVTAGANLLLVTGLMMSIRVLSTLALHVAIWRRVRLRVEVGWLSRLAGIAIASGVIAYGTGLLVPGRIADLIVVPTVCVVLFLALVRVLRMLREEDASLADRILPVGGRVIRALSGPKDVVVPAHPGAPMQRAAE